MAIKRMLVFCVCMGCRLISAGQSGTDTAYISGFDLPYVARLSLEQTGAGVEISPDNSLALPTAGFPFNTGTNLGFNVSYKFINLSVSQSIRHKTSNQAFAIGGNAFNGRNNFGGRLGFYSNVAAVQDKRNLKVRSSVNLFKCSPYWLLNTNERRLSLAAITDYSQRQKRSAGAFLIEVNPYYLHVRGKNGPIIPTDNAYKAIFENMAGLQRLSIVNLDFRAGYVYTRVFEEGTYFLSGALLLGPGFGYHHAVAQTGSGGMHWQSSLRLTGSGGYNGDQFFVVGAFRYTNSFTPVSAIGVLANDATFSVTVGIRLEAFESVLPDTWQELLGVKQ